MKKYIIKNCPARFYEFINDEQKCFLKDRKCKHIPDCLIKQIVELCKKQKESCIFATAFIADEILKLLQIEEVE